MFNSLNVCLFAIPTITLVVWFVVHALIVKRHQGAPFRLTDHRR